MCQKRRQKRKGTWTTTGNESHARVESPVGDLSFPETQEATVATEGEALKKRH